MEINPFESRLRMLQQIDGVQMQREAAPDEETAGCPGCPFFWTCPVPHRGEEVRAPKEIELEDVREILGPRREYAPRDESDIGWTDVWLDEEGLPIDHEEARAVARAEAEAVAEPSSPAEESTIEESTAEVSTADGTAPASAAREHRGWRGLFRRRR